jgi:hypothetical protein
MNSQFAVVENLGGKCVVASWEQSVIDPNWRMIKFQSKDHFLFRHSHRQVGWDVTWRTGARRETMPLAQWWFANRGRRQYRGVIFMPNGLPEIGEHLNLWQGWGVEGKEGDWSLIKAHISEVVAGNNSTLAEYVMRWIAWIIQNPNKQAEVALVLIGEKGSGKGTLARCLQRIFGIHSLQVTDREQVIGKFNAHLEDCVLFIADEAYWGGDKRCVGRLQGMITEPTLPIERKGFDVYQVKNFLHLLMLAEPGWVIPAGKFERRYAALNVNSGRRGDREYFRRLHRQIDNGGAAAMFWDLRRVDLGDWHPREIPEALLHSEALRQQQTLTLPPWEQWYLSLLQDGRLPGAISKHPNWAYTYRLLDSVKELVPRLKFDASDIALRDFMVSKGFEKYHGKNQNGWKFAPLAICRADFDRAYGPRRWDNPNAEWGDKPEEEG